MLSLNLIIVNKSGGLIFNTSLSPLSPQLTTNDWLRIGSTFHSLHAIAREAQPNNVSSSQTPNSSSEQQQYQQQLAQQQQQQANNNNNNDNMYGVMPPIPTQGIYPQPMQQSQTNSVLSALKPSNPLKLKNFKNKFQSKDSSSQNNNNSNNNNNIREQSKEQKSAQYAPRKESSRPTTGIETVLAGPLTLKCLQTLTGVKFILTSLNPNYITTSPSINPATGMQTEPTVTVNANSNVSVNGIVPPPTNLADLEKLLVEFYVLYCDYALKNPFYETDMPIRSEVFNANVLRVSKGLATI